MDMPIDSVTYAGRIRQDRAKIPLSPTYISPCQISFPLHEPGACRMPFFQPSTDTKRQAPPGSDRQVLSQPHQHPSKILDDYSALAQSCKKFCIYCEFSPTPPPGFKSSPRRYCASSPYRMVFRMRIWNGFLRQFIRGRCPPLLWRYIRNNLFPLLHSAARRALPCR